MYNKSTTMRSLYLQWRPGLILAMVLLAVAACQKSGENSGNTSKSKTQLLTQKTWKIVAHTVNPAVDLNGDGTADSDVFATVYEACNKDDIYSFKSDGTGLVDEGPTKCTDSDPQSTALEWLFKSSETVIQIKQGLVSLDFNVVELSESTLKVSYTQSNGTITVTQTITYAHP